jgi:hypothetical protein
MWGFAGLVKGSAPLKCISRTTLFIGVITIYAIECKGQFSFLTVLGQFIINVTSNQVGLPAELKHINKRRKRN